MTEIFRVTAGPCRAAAVSLAVPGRRPRRRTAAGGQHRSVTVTRHGLRLQLELQVSSSRAGESEPGIQFRAGPSESRADESARQRHLRLGAAATVTVLAPPARGRAGLHTGNLNRPRDSSVTVTPPVMARPGGGGSPRPICRWVARAG